MKIAKMALLMLVTMFMASMTFPTLSYAGDNNGPNPCGNHGNNCNPGPGTGGGAGGDGGAGGAGGDGGAGGSAFSWSSLRNTNTNAATSTATGGTAVATGGQGGIGVGGSSTSENVNTINVEGDHYKRNAPSIAGGVNFPTASCKGGFGIGGSGLRGSGLINIATTDKECQTVLLADHFATIGMPDVACELFKTTATWGRAVKKNPALVADCKK